MMEPSSPSVSIDIGTEKRPTDLVAEPHRIRHTSFEDKEFGCCAKIMISLCLLIFILPFIAVDLYFGYSDQPCLTTDFDNPDITIGTWLRVSGFVQLGYLIIMCSTFFANKDIGELLRKLTKYLFGMFFTAWTIVGSVIFWKYLEPNELCDNSLTKYLWARLIIGLINIGCGLFVK